MTEPLYLNGVKVDNPAEEYLSLSEIDLTKKTYKDNLEIILCRPDETEISILSEAYNVVMTTVFKDIDELEFDVPYYIAQQYKQTKNLNWDLIKDDYLIKVNNIKMFVINTTEEQLNDGKKIKHVHCYSREYQLGKKNLRSLQGTRQLYRDTVDGTVVKIKYSYDGTNYQEYTAPFISEYGKDIYIKLYDLKGVLVDQYLWNSSNKLIQTKGISVTYSVTDTINSKIQVTIKIIAEIGNGVLNILEEDTSWRVGFLDPLIREDKSLGQDHRKYRTFDITEKPWIEFLKDDVQKTFECIIIYDTIHKLVNVYSIDTLTQNKGLYISEENYIKTLKEDTKTDELITRLWVYGKDNLSIASINPTGKPYIENYSYYRNLDYMSQEMLDKMTAYDNLVKEETPIFYNYLTDLENLYGVNSKLNSELVDLKSSYQIEYDKIDAAAQSNGTPINLGTTSNFDPNKDLVAVINANISSPLYDCSTIIENLKSITSQINSKNAEISNNQVSIQNKLNQIEALRNLLDKKNGQVKFTDNELALLDGLTHEKTWSNANYNEPKELLSAGMVALDSLCKPTIEFNIDIVDLLNILECQHDWDKINIGDKINIYYSPFNIAIEARIVKINHQIDGCSLSLTISTNDEVDDPIKYLSDIAKSTSDTSNTIDIFKHEWDVSTNNQDVISDILNNAWDSAKNAVLSGRNQNISIDERGISLKNLVSDGREVKMINNVIAFTSDNWTTVGTAITADGIAAKQLYGKVIGSNKLIITNVNDNGESSFLVDKNHMEAVNMDLALENKTNVNRIYMNPDQGFKIQKKISGAWEDQLWQDPDGNVYAKSFHVINTHSTLDDDGLVIDNGYIKINNQTGDTVFNVDTNGDVNALGRFQVFRYDGKDKVILADLYKDQDKGGKLAINEWYGKKDVFIGSSPDDKYIGGFLKLYNEGEDKPRIEMGIFHDDDAGTINLSDASNTPKVHISAKDGLNNHGIISLLGEDKNPKLILKARSDTDNMSNTLSGDRKTGGYIEFNSYDNSTKYFITANNENNFGLYDTLRSAFEINHNNNSVSVGHQANEILTLANGVITLGFSTVEHEYDLAKPYLRMTETGLILGMGDNKLSITSSGVKLDGTRLDLN